MDFVLKANEYERLINVCEKFSGTVEPGFRFLKIYYRKGLKLFATDGCGKLELSIPRKVESFVGTYLLPTDYAKALKEQLEAETDIRLTGDPEKLSLFAAKENLTIEKALLEGYPVMERKFEILFGMQLKDLRAGLDFVSSTSMEGENISMVSNGITTGLVAESSNMFLFSKLDVQQEKNIEFSLPYVTVRHMVKTFELLKTDEVVFGEGIEDVGVKTGGALMSICVNRNADIPANTIDICENINKKATLEKRILVTALRKMCRLVSKGFNVLLVSGKKGMKIYLKKGTLRYESSIAETPFEDFIVKIDPHRLRSALNRIGGSKLSVDINSNNLILFNERSRRYIFIPLSH